MSEKPTLTEAIEWGKDFEDVESLFEDHELMTVCVRGVPFVRRLVEAGEKWLEFEQEERDRKIESDGLELATESMSAEKDRRIEELNGLFTKMSAECESYCKTIQTLRRQLDDLGKENVGKGRRIGELKKERKAWTDEIVERGQIIKAMGITRDHRLDEDEEIKDLRSQLAEKERELERLSEWKDVDPNFTARGTLKRLHQVLNEGEKDEKTYFRRAMRIVNTWRESQQSDPESTEDGQ